MTVALEGGEWSAARHGRTLPLEKTRYPFYRRLGGPQGRAGRKENLIPTGTRSRTVQPLAQSLHRLSYLAHNIPNNMEQKCSTVLHLLYWYTVCMSVPLVVIMLFNVEHFIFTNLTQHNYMILKIL